MPDGDRVLVADIAQSEIIDVETETIGEETRGLAFPSSAARVGLPPGQKRLLLPDVGPDGSKRAVHEVTDVDVANERFCLTLFGGNPGPDRKENDERHNECPPDCLHVQSLILLSHR